MNYFQKISPGAVDTEFGPISGFPQELLAQIPALYAQDVAEAVIYALSTSPNVNASRMRYFRIHIVKYNCFQVNDIILKAI